VRRDVGCAMGASGIEPCDGRFVVRATMFDGRAGILLVTRESHCENAHLRWVVAGVATPATSEATTRISG
jgi:hypothetical protein